LTYRRSVDVSGMAMNMWLWFKSVT